MGNKISPIHIQLSDQEFVDLFNKSKSIREILDYFHLSFIGGNYLTVKNRCNQLNLDYSAKCRQGITTMKRKTTKFTLEEIFTSNSKVDRFTVKREILRHNLIPYICSSCGQEPFWQNKPLVLILDHINGVNNDHEIRNLRFVCPNCNIQLDTNSGKNSKIKYRSVEHNCSVCGKSVRFRSNMCRACCNVSQQKIDWPSSEILRNRVNQSSYAQVARELGVSSTSVRGHMKD